MDENYEELFQRIRAKCRQQRWHGPDGSNPFEFVAQERKRYEKQQERIRQLRAQKKGAFITSMGRATRYWYDRNGKQYTINLETDLEAFPLQTDFEYPPLSEEEMAVIEHNRGYRFPPLLRSLYTTVANGGFGPSYGLIVLSPETVLADGSPIKSHSRPIDLALYLRRYTSSVYFEFPWYVWPKSLFRLCEDGCGYSFYLDCASGRVFYGGAGKDGFGLDPQADSLEEWLDLWLKGVHFPRERTTGEKSDA